MPCWHAQPALHMHGLHSTATHCVNPAGWTELSGDVGMAEGSVVTALVASKLLLPAELSPRETCGTRHRAGCGGDEL